MQVFEETSIDRILEKALTRFGQLGVVIGIISLLLSIRFAGRTEIFFSVMTISSGLFIWLSGFLELNYRPRALISQTFFSCVIGFGIGSGIFNGALISWLFVLPLFSWFYLGANHSLRTIIAFAVFLGFIFINPFDIEFHEYSLSEKINSFFNFSVAAVLIFFGNRVWKNFALQLHEALTMKDLLIREIYHRTRNNLALVDNFMRLEAAKSESDEVEQISDELTLKIQTIISVNERLYSGDSINSLDLDHFLNDLIPKIKELYRTRTLSVNFKTANHSITVSPDNAVKIGIILNELMTNSFKHAFKETESPEINLETKLFKQKVLIVYSDNGPGLSLDTDENFGTAVIRNLIKDLPDGSLSVTG